MAQIESPRLFENINIFTIFDYLSKGVNFTVNRNQKTYSYLGLFVSIFIYFVFFLSFFFSGRHYFFQKNAYFTEEKDVLDMPFSLNYTPTDNLFFALRVRSNKSSKKSLLNSQFTLNMKQIISFKNDTAGLVKDEGDKVQNCTEIEGNALLNNLTNFLCFPISELFFNNSTELNEIEKNNYLNNIVESYQRITIERLSNKDDPSITDIYIDLHYPVLVRSPNDLKYPVKIKYKHIIELYTTHNIPHRDLFIENYLLIDDKGYIWEDFKETFGLGIGETQVRTIYSTRDLNYIYSMTIQNGLQFKTYRRFYQKIQDLLANSLAVFTFLTFVAKIMLYIPLNYLHKIYLCNIVSTVIDGQERERSISRFGNLSKSNKDEGVVIFYKNNLKNIIDKISDKRKRSLDALLLNENNNNKNTNFYNIENPRNAQLATLKNTDLDDKTGIPNNDYINVTEINNHTFVNHHSRHTSSNTLYNNSSNNHFMRTGQKIKQSSKFAVIAPVAKVPSPHRQNKTDFFSPNIEQAKRKRRQSIDLLSLQVHTQNNITPNVMESSNAVPFQNFDTKPENTDSNMHKGQLFRISPLKISNKNNASEKSLSKSSTIMQIPLQKNKNIKTKFSFSFCEILRKMTCTDIRLGEKAKWNLYSLLNEYVEDKLDITSYFDMLNESRLTKSFLLNTQLNTAIKHLSHPHLVIKNFEEMTTKDTEFLKQNSQNIRKAFNIPTQEKKEEENNLMAEYFAKKIFEGEITQIDNIILFNLDEETSDLVTRRLKLLHNDLVDGKVPEFVEVQEKETF